MCVRERQKRREPLAPRHFPHSSFCLKVKQNRKMDIKLGEQCHTNTTCKALELLVVSLLHSLQIGISRLLSFFYIPYSPHSVI